MRGSCWPRTGMARLAAAPTMSRARRLTGTRRRRENLADAATSRIVSSNAPEDGQFTGHGNGSTRTKLTDEAPRSLAGRKRPHCTAFLLHLPIGCPLASRETGWGARIRTWEWRNQNPLPYHLATPQQAPEHRG